MAISKHLCEYFRCPERYASFSVKDSVSSDAKFFEFGGNILFGRNAETHSQDYSSLSDTHQVLEGPGNGGIPLPFDIDETVDNLRLERYNNSSNHNHPANSIVGQCYYLVRPLLPVKVRRHLQKAKLNSWRELKFPHWPVDRTVDHAMREFLLLSRRAHGKERIPFIWFWPEGSTGAAVVTHDVETGVGRDYCETLMDIDDSFGIKGAFEVVPEKRYQVPPAFIDSIWNRGFEVAVHDLDHDGRLFRDREIFLERVSKINAYGKQYHAEGFRAAVLYRNQEWYDALEFAYDTSVPNVAHLDPQRGGCCTVMPYFVGNLVELPVTVIQDYSLYQILNDYSINIWKQQIELILETHGLINVIIHPDYNIAPRERAVYEQFLAHLAAIREERSVWVALPKDVAQWWRQRSQMRIVEDENGLRIEGEGKERARIAHASEKDGHLVLDVSPSNTGCGVKKRVLNGNTMHGRSDRAI